MKILYIHGLSSSGNSRTAERLRCLLPDDTIISPDLPIEPLEALEILKKFVAEENIDLVIGTSMGGMFAQKLRGIHKILVNPSFRVSQSMRHKLGINRFFSERSDGISEYEITHELCDKYEKIERSQFLNLPASESDNTIGLFGSEDNIVNCQTEYLQFYCRHNEFQGGHRLNEKVIRESLLPLIEQLREKLYFEDR